LKGEIIRISRSPARSVRGNVLATSEFNLSMRVRYRLVGPDGKPLSPFGEVVGTTSFFVGTDVTGTIPRPNGIGLFLKENSSNNTIGGSTPDARNVISGNGNFGILVLFSSSNTIQGNRIGTDLTGTIGLGNGSNGVFLAESFGNNVGGTKPGEGNVISANFGAGIQIIGTVTLLIRSSGP